MVVVDVLSNLESDDDRDGGGCYFGEQQNELITYIKAFSKCKN